MLTDEEKEELYMNPKVDLVTGLNNKIKGLSSIIESAKIEIDRLKNIDDAVFSNEVRIEFAFIGISKKSIILKMYNVLICDWKKELKEAKLELKKLDK